VFTSRQDQIQGQQIQTKLKTKSWSGFLSIYTCTMFINIAHKTMQRESLSELSTFEILFIL